MKQILRFILLIVCVLLLVTACNKNDSIKSVADQSFTEEFDTTSAATARGWIFNNTSSPKGPGVWLQGGGVPKWFNAFSNTGSNAGFIGTDFTSTSAAQGIISNWIISPVVTLQNGDKISFYTRAYLDPLSPSDSTDWGNSLQVRLNIENQSTYAGSGLNPGDFTIELFSINPTYVEYHTNPALYSPVAYPGKWTQFIVTVSGLTKSIKGRFAFRYFVEEAGFNGRASGVAIDKVDYTSVKK
jgi:hypothetical protein